MRRLSACVALGSLICLAIIGSAVGEAQATEELLRRIEQLEKRLAETETSQAAATAKAEAAKSEAASEKKEPPAVEFLKSVDVGGFVDVSYGYNFNSPNVRKGGNALRVFDTDDNSFNFDLLEVYAQRTADNPGDAGFRVDLNFGRIADLIDIDHEFGGDDDFDVEQAYVSYNAPIGNGLLIDFGKFVTLHGAEVIESKDNLNFSRSFLFGFAIPFTHTGLRVKYPFSDKASYSQYVVNGWDNVVDNNAPKTLGGQLGLTPTENASFYFNWMFGAEKENNESDKRALIDLVGAYRVSPSLAFVLNYDFATEDNAALDGGDAEWQGVAGYVDYDLSDKIGFALRGEWFNDHDGARTGTAQDLYEVTLTGEYHWTDHLMNRLEYRHDWSSKDSFLEDDDFDDQQDTVFFNVVYMF